VDTLILPATRQRCANSTDAQFARTFRRKACRRCRRAPRSFRRVQHVELRLRQVMTSSSVCRANDRMPLFGSERDEQIGHATATTRWRAGRARQHFDVDPSGWRRRSASTYRCRRAASDRALRIGRPNSASAASPPCTASIEGADRDATRHVAQNRMARRPCRTRPQKPGTRPPPESVRASKIDAEPIAGRERNRACHAGIARQPGAVHNERDRDSVRHSPTPTVAKRPKFMLVLSMPKFGQ